VTDDWRQEPEQPPMMPIGEPPPAYLPPAGPQPNPQRQQAFRIGFLAFVVLFFGFPALVSLVMGSPMAFVWGFLFLIFGAATLAIFAMRKQH